MVRLTEKQAQLFLGKNFGAVATIRADGTPHVTPVWIDYDGEHVVFNTATGRAKWHHMSSLITHLAANAGNTDANRTVKRRVAWAAILRCPCF